MAYEIDFLEVGDPGEDGRCCRSGDAISLRYGDLANGEQTVIIVDGGFQSAGTKLVEHVKKFYQTDTVDFVINSHPHDDHIQGLFPVLESLRVGTLLMHKPWEHAQGVQELLGDNRTTISGTRRRLKESFAAARELHNLAIRKEIEVCEPMQGTRTRDNVMLVLGPSREFYQRCIAADLAGLPLGASRGLASLLLSAAHAAMRAVQEGWDAERLTEPAPDAVEPLNHSSTITYFNFGETRALLTADAGVQALSLAADYAESLSIDLKACTYVQVPHHGSKRNVGPTILNRIIGPILPQGTAGTKTGKISCAKDGEPKHPSARVTNAFLRRGAACCSTQGRTILWASPDAPVRPGWTNVPFIPFRDRYDEEED